MFYVLLDRMQPAKPDAQEVAAITYRLQHAAGVECSEGQFCDRVRRGGTFVCATFEPQTPGKRGWNSFVQQQLIALDFDNKEAALGPFEALERCDRLGLKPLCLYFTFSSAPQHLRYRLVFDLGVQLKKEEEARKAIQTALALFPEADHQCCNPNRLFFGSNGETWEAWQVWTNTQPNIEVLRNHWRRLKTSQAARYSGPQATQPCQRHGGNQNNGATDIQAMCAQVDLLALVQADTGESGHQSGNGVQFHTCPVCGHHDDLTVWNDNTYTCFSSSCPWPRNANGNHGGDVLTYLKYAHHNGDTIAAVRELRQLTNNPYHKNARR